VIFNKYSKTYQNYTNGKKKIERINEDDSNSQNISGLYGVTSWWLHTVNKFYTVSLRLNNLDINLTNFI
jgi:hypothetical protein